MSFGCLAVRLLFQVDYNQNASKSTNSWEKQVAVLTLGLLIRLWNAGGCWNGHMHTDSTFLKMSMPSVHSLSTCKVRVLATQVVVWWLSITCQSCYDVEKWKQFMTISGMWNAAEAETGLERLHQCAEKDLQMFIDTENTSPSFNDFRSKLAGLTRWRPLLDSLPWSNIF